MPRTLKLDLEDLAAETDGWVKMLTRLPELDPLLLKLKE